LVNIDQMTKLSTNRRDRPRSQRFKAPAIAYLVEFTQSNHVINEAHATKGGTGFVLRLMSEELLSSVCGLHRTPAG
jgi:hypothetical protein